MNDNKKFAGISSLLFLAIFILENINGHFWLNDFKVYYEASKALVSGNQVYGIPFGLETGFYKYAPSVLLIFTPAVLLPYPAACILHFILISVSFILLVITVNRIFEKAGWRLESRYPYLLFLVTLLCAARQVVHELHLGNVNAILLLLLSAALKLLLENKPGRAGVLLGISFLCKPYFLLLLLPLAAYRKFKALGYAGLTAAVAIILPAVFFGLQKDLQLHREWFDAMRAHDSYLYSYHTLLSLVKTYVYPAPPEMLSIFLIGAMALLYGICFLITHRLDGKTTDPRAAGTRSFILQYFTTIAIIPNLVTTDTEHFLYAIPLIALLGIAVSRTPTFAAIGCFVLLMLLYGGNTSDLLGTKLSDRLEYLGIMGISNLIMISAVLYLFSIQPRIKKQETDAG